MAGLIWLSNVLLTVDNPSPECIKQAQACQVSHGFGMELEHEILYWHGFLQDQGWEIILLKLVAFFDSWQHLHNKCNYTGQVVHRVD